MGVDAPDVTDTSRWPQPGCACSRIRAPLECAGPQGCAVITGVAPHTVGEMLGQGGSSRDSANFGESASVPTGGMRAGADARRGSLTAAAVCCGAGMLRVAIVPHSMSEPPVGTAGCGVLQGAAAAAHCLGGWGPWGRLCWF